jgi:hypothetical protein
MWFFAYCDRRGCVAYMHWHPSLVAVVSLPATVERDVEIGNVHCKLFKVTVTWPNASNPAEYTVILTAIQPYMAKKSGIFKGQSSRKWHQCYLLSMLSVCTHNYIYWLKSLCMKVSTSWHAKDAELIWATQLVLNYHFYVTIPTNICTGKCMYILNFQDL